MNYMPALPAFELIVQSGETWGAIGGFNFARRGWRLSLPRCLGCLDHASMPEFMRIPAGEPHLSAEIRIKSSPCLAVLCNK